MGGSTFEHQFTGEAFQGKVNFPTGVFINNEWSDGGNGGTLEWVQP